jgi:hypothetical protein
MKKSQLIQITHLTWFGAVVLMVCLLSSARAQTPETLVATASVKNATGASLTAPLTASITRFASDAERDALLAAVKKGGTAAARQLLEKGADVGTIELSSRKTSIKYAYARTLGGGDRLITLITAQPVFFLGAGAPGAKPKEGFDLGLVLLELKASGPGKGELAPAAKVRVDAQNAIVTEDYGAELVQLTNVVKK